MKPEMTFFARWAAGYALIGAYRVRTLIEGKVSLGEHTVVWDGTDDRGRPVASGVYLRRLEAVDRGSVATRRLLLLR